MNASECNQCLFRFYKYLHASFVHGLFEIKPSNSLNGKCVHLCILKQKITKTKSNQTKAKCRMGKKVERKRLRLIHMNTQLFFTFHQWLCLCAPGKMFKQFNFICTPAVHESLHRPRFNALKIQVYLPNTETNFARSAFAQPNYRKTFNWIILRIIFNNNISILYEIYRVYVVQLCKPNCLNTTSQLN